MGWMGSGGGCKTLWEWTNQLDWLIIFCRLYWIMIDLTIYFTKYLSSLVCIKSLSSSSELLFKLIFLLLHNLVYQTSFLDRLLILKLWKWIVVIWNFHFTLSSWLQSEGFSELKLDVLLISIKQTLLWLMFLLNVFWDVKCLVISLFRIFSVIINMSHLQHPVII